MHAVRSPLVVSINKIAQHARPATARLFGTTAARNVAAAQSGEPKSAALNPRWFTDLKGRIKKCLSLQIGAEDTKLLRERLDYLDKHWLELSAGREGFLPADRWRGLDKHSVAWGEMDSMPMTYPDNVTVLHKLVEKPNYSSDSIILEAIILSERHQRPAARCFEDIAVYDYQAARRAPLKDFMVDELRATYDLQEQGKEDAESRVAELHREMDQIEDRLKSSQT